MISTMYEGIRSRDDRAVECLWKTSGRALGGDFRSREIIEKYNLSVCRLSIQYVNLLIYLFQLRPAFNSSKYYFFQAHPTRGLSTVSTDMTANRASLLVFTLLVCCLLVSKHGPCSPAVCGIPSMSTMDTKKG